jgi:hypothetical protein
VHKERNPKLAGWPLKCRQSCWCAYGSTRGEVSTDIGVRNVTTGHGLPVDIAVDNFGDIGCGLRSVGGTRVS